ncbi:MAG: TadE/TadG family type IV pilus assembly protein [Bryobacteraceae bacterium]
MKRILQVFGRLCRDRSGNAMMEFAIGAGVLVAAFTGTFQFGYTFYQYNSLSNGVNQGARYAAMRVYDSPNSTPSQGFLTAVKNMVVYGDPAGGATPILPGLTTAHVNVVPTFTNNVPTLITVSINGYQLDAAVKTITFINKPRASFVYQGFYSPY